MNQSGTTLFEILITVAILSIIATIGITRINFKSQIDKGNDARRKQDLDTLKTALDDFYNDNGRYPLPVELCYNGNSADTTCDICGTVNTPPEFTAYMPKLPCDPHHDAKTYRYEVSDINTPQWYRIFAQLTNTNDSQSCGACGPDGDQVYSYGVSSSNKNILNEPTIAPYPSPEPDSVTVE